VIEKMGIFSRLVEDMFFDDIPCILLCGKGYPSVTTRAMLAMMAAQFRYEQQ
jgi:DNA topoisomerase VI subunit A